MKNHEHNMVFYFNFLENWINEDRWIIKII